MPAKTTEQEVFDLEKQYWQAIQDKNVDVMLRLTDAQCLITGAQGVQKLDKKELAEMTKSMSWSMDRFELSENQVRMLGDNVAIVAYKVHEELTIDGKPVKFDAADSSTWVRRDGSWVCALHTEAIAGDPFGRDRRPSAEGR